jgi:peroxiredoxin
MRTSNFHHIVLALSLSLLGACGQESAEAPAPEGTAEEPVAAATAMPEAAPEEMQPESLTAQLEARVARFKEMAPPDRIAAAEGAIAEIAASGILEKAVKKGDKAPDFTLPNAIGESVNLYAALENGPVILTWYRGSWCPYCNIQLHSYQESLGTIADAGAQLMAVSPELPDSALTWKEKEELEFAVLSDLGNEVAREYGVVYRIPDAISAGYVAGGRNDLTEYNGDDSLELPLAVTYVIDSDGTVVYSFVDADYRKRAETSEVVEAVTQLAAE